MGQEPFFQYAKNLISPVDDAATVAELGGVDTDFTENGNPIVSRAIYIGSAGDVEVVMKSGRTVVFKAPTAGVWHAMRVKQIKSANTTATVADILIGW